MVLDLGLLGCRVWRSGLRLEMWSRAKLQEGRSAVVRERHLRQNLNPTPWLIGQQQLLTTLKSETSHTSRNSFGSGASDAGTGASASAFLFPASEKRKPPKP